MAQPRRQIMRLGVTAHPTTQRIADQLMKAGGRQRTRVFLIENCLALPLLVARQDTGAHETELCRLPPLFMKRAARRISASILQLSEAGG
jgi:hypothetical protein